jgi:hypothetical protein
MTESKLGPKTLRVIIRNDAPMIFCNDSPSYRSVEIELTPLQRKKMALQYVGTNCGTQIFEGISKTFFDDPITEVKR